MIKLAQTGLMAALCFVTFYIFTDKDTAAGRRGDIFSCRKCHSVCWAALILGGGYGGLAGAIGMGIADMLDPGILSQVRQRPFVLKLCIGLITGLVAHRIAKINESTDREIYFPLEYDRFNCPVSLST